MPSHSDTGPSSVQSLIKTPNMMGAIVLQELTNYWI